MSQIGRLQFKLNTHNLYPDNTSGEISPMDLRAQMDNIADSSVFFKSHMIGPPTQLDDLDGTAGNGKFDEGDIWVDEVNDNAYMCIDATPSNAIWHIIAGEVIVRTYTNPEPGQMAMWDADNILIGVEGLDYDPGTGLTVTNSNPSLKLVEDAASTNNQWWSIDALDERLKVTATNEGAAYGDYVFFRRDDIDITDFVLTNRLGTLYAEVDQSGMLVFGQDAVFGTNDAYNTYLRASGTDIFSVQKTASGNYLATLHGSGTNLSQFRIGGTNNLSTGNANIEVGYGRSGDGHSYIDFISDGAVYTDYGMRLIRNAGANGNSILHHRGTGVLYLNSPEASKTIIKNNGLNTATFDSDNTVEFASDTTVYGRLGVGADPVLANAEIYIDAENARIRLHDSVADARGDVQMQGENMLISVDNQATASDPNLEFRVQNQTVYETSTDLAQIHVPLIAPRRVKFISNEDYTLEEDDYNTILVMANSGPQVVTIPGTGSVPLPVGSDIRIMSVNYGTITVQCANTNVHLNGNAYYQFEFTGPATSINLTQISNQNWWAGTSVTATNYQPVVPVTSPTYGEVAVIGDQWATGTTLGIGYNDVVNTAMTTHFNMVDQGGFVDLEVDGISNYVGPGEVFSPDATLHVSVSGVGTLAALEMSWTPTSGGYQNLVQDVSFRVNDIDRNDPNRVERLTVEAYDASNARLPVTYDLGSYLGVNTSTGLIYNTVNTGDGPQPWTPQASAKISVAGPVRRIKLIFANAGAATGSYGMWITDVAYTAIPL